MNAAAMIEQIYLDRDAPVALHHQLTRGIADLISNGFLGPGDRLPNVQDIAAISGVSVATAMRAVGSLAREGRLVSKRGQGTFVAETRPPMTEVLMCQQAPGAGSYLWGFYQVLIDGLREGFGEKNRRFTVTWPQGGDMTATEIVGGATARRVDGLVAYRPPDTMVETLHEVARSLPLVSLYRLIPGGCADCVAGDPNEPLRRMIRNRIARGQTDFAYIGHERYFDRELSMRLYRAAHESWQNELAAQGVQGRVCLSGVEDPTALECMPRAWEFTAEAVGSLPDGCTVLAQTPNFIHMMRGEHRRLDVITYTEYAHNLEEWPGEVSFLYLGLEDLARAAAPLLRNPSSPGGPRARVVKVSPRIIERRGAAAQQGTG